MIRAPCMPAAPCLYPQSGSSQLPWLYPPTRTHQDFCRFPELVPSDAIHDAALQKEPSAERKAKSETHCAVAFGCVGLSAVNRRKGLSPTFWLRSGLVPPLQILLELPWRSEAIPTRGRRPLLNEWSNTFPSWLIQTRVPLSVTRCYLAVMTRSHSAGTMQRQIYKSFAKGRMPSWKGLVSLGRVLLRSHLHK